MYENTPRHDPSDDSAADYHPPELVGTVVRYDGAPDECTVYPRDATEAELLTTWITAAESSFVDLEEMR
ncbi:hypothetical protein ACFO0N_06815 [Halobium salinum]|uniref:DUF7511 domain-containing protein n=1 Tax=Halobium salinum TaxID=1364940 RepID=A0ABD5PA98_9EURY|nr:hypothetical protein [Halobium salinum]